MDIGSICKIVSESASILKFVVPFVEERRQKARDAACFVLGVLADTYEHVDANENEQKLTDYAIAKKWSEAAKQIGPYSEPAAELCLKLYNLFLKGEVSADDLPTSLDFKIDGNSFRLMLAESRVSLIDQDGSEKLLFSRDHLWADVVPKKAGGAGRLVFPQLEGRNFKPTITKTGVVSVTGVARPKLADMDVLQVVQPEAPVLKSVKKNRRHGRNGPTIDI